ncbi:MAG TPA: serine/threonine-protein kinase [Pseudomonadota bacterium]|nr:serine/threonine-protein kinase [Pseudomonadota bacterium]
MAEQYIGPYRVVREIGRGGMGAVFEAVQPQIERRVAIKVLHSQFAQNEQLVRRFSVEARAVNIVNHPSVVQITDFGQLPDGTAYIVMEFLDGESLGSRMKRQGGKLSIVESLRLSRQIAAALAAAHTKNIIHRDLKPDNVMIVADPEAPGGERAKVLDFGIAKVAAAVTPGADNPIEAMSTTRTGVMVGTPLYMAPEQCKGNGQVDAKADVYSLGVMLYRMLCGRPPFIGDGAGAVMAMHIYEPPPPLREFEPAVPEDLANLVHALLEKNPANRPTMQQVAHALEQLKAVHSTGLLASGELHLLASGGLLSGNYSPITPHPSTPAPMTPVPITPAPINPAATAQGLGPVRITGNSESMSAMRSGAASVSSSGLLTLSQVGASGPSQPVLSSGPNSVSQTLGPAEAQVGNPAPKRSAGFAVGIVAGSILLGAALFGLVALRHDDNKDGNRPANEGTTSLPTTANKVTWTISSEPAGATVVRATDQRILGRTPWRSEQPQSAGSQVLILRLAGYADRVVTMDQTANAVVKESLVALVTTPPPAAPVVAAPPPVQQPMRWIKRGGKRIPIKPAAPAAESPSVASAPPPAAPPPVAAPKPNPPPPKEETPHARIQVVD